MTGAQTGVLVVALAAPVMGALLAGAWARRPGWRSRPAGTARCGAQLAATFAAVAWLVLVAGGANGDVGRFHLTPLVAAAGCGAALLTVAALESLRSSRSIAATSAALTAVGLGLSAGSAGLQAAAFVAGLTAAAALTLRAAPAGARSKSSPTPRRPSLLGRRIGVGMVSSVAGIAGVLACGVGFVVVHGRGGRWVLPTAGVQSLAAISVLLGAAALLSAAGALGRRRPASVLLAAGLFLGLSVAPLRAGADDLGAVLVALAAGAVVAAGVRQGTLSLALLALAAAAGPAALTPASRLLAAAAVISVAVGAPWAWLSAVPAGVSLVAGVIDDGSRLALAVALVAAVVAVLLALVSSERSTRSSGPADDVDDRAGADGDGRSPPGAWPAIPIGAWPAIPVGAWPAVAAGAWLAVAPGTWTWTGATLRAYDLGMGRAVAAGLVVVVARLAIGAWGRERAMPVSPREEPSLVPAPPRQPSRQLVRSVRSASTPRPRRAIRSQRARPRRRPDARAPERPGKSKPRPRRLGGEGPPPTR